MLCSNLDLSFFCQSEKGCHIGLNMKAGYTGSMIKNTKIIILWPFQARSVFSDYVETLLNSCAKAANTVQSEVLLSSVYVWIRWKVEHPMHSRRDQRCPLSSNKYFLDTLKQSKRQSMSAAGKQWGRELCERLIFSKPWLGLGWCVCVCLCACIHAWRKPVVKTSALQSVTGSPWIIHRAFSRASYSRFCQIVLEMILKSKCAVSEVGEAFSDAEKWNTTEQQDLSANICTVIRAWSFFYTELQRWKKTLQQEGHSFDFYSVYSLIITSQRGYL